LQTSELEPGYSHTIPYVIAFQGLLLNDNIIIVKESPGGSAEAEEAPSPCAPSAAALGLSFLVLVAVHITKKA
jgi:hypothetical protein